MKGLRCAVSFNNMWIVYLVTLVLALLVVFQLYAKSLTAPQSILMSGGVVREGPADGLPIGAGTVVVMVYTITIPESTLFIPSRFTQFAPGDHELLPNLEVALTGMKQGQTKRVELSSEEAFGPYDAAKQLEVSKDRLPEGAEPGMLLATEDGTPCVLVELSETMAKIDFNHPLAGKRVVIDVRILDVKVPPLDERGLQLDDDVTGAPLRV
jgi:FKBP-type peptidyl-prolyl cis-trans isomerase 2